MTDISRHSAKDSDSSVFLETPEAGEELNFNQFPADRFTHITPLCKSAGGVIQLFTATRYGKRFILKCLAEKYQKDPVYRMVLRKEFEIGIGLDHPYIRRTFGFENIEGLGEAIIMEYIDGETLEQGIRNGHVNCLNARAIAGKLAQALEYLHKRQIVHRDIKPTNVLVTYSGDNVKLIDFSLSDSDAFVVIKNPAGTQRYMAPEILVNASQASAKTDIYSFGKTLLDLSAAVGDSKLKSVAKLCCKEDPAERPNSISEIEIPMQKVSKSSTRKFSLESESMTYVLTCLIVILILLISYKLF